MRERYSKNEKEFWYRLDGMKSVERIFRAIICFGHSWVHIFEDFDGLGCDRTYICTRCKTIASVVYGCSGHRWRMWAFRKLSLENQVKVLELLRHG